MGISTDQRGWARAELAADLVDMQARCAGWRLDPDGPKPAPQAAETARWLLGRCRRVLDQPFEPDTGMWQDQQLSSLAVRSSMSSVHRFSRSGVWQSWHTTV